MRKFLSYLVGSPQINLRGFNLFVMKLLIKLNRKCELLHQINQRLDGNVKRMCVYFGLQLPFTRSHRTSSIFSCGNIPLIANDEDTAELAKTYYPEVETRLWPDIEFRLKEIADEFDMLFNCQYWEPFVKRVLSHLSFAKKCTSYFALMVNRIKAINLPY